MFVRIKEQLSKKSSSSNASSRETKLRETSSARQKLKAIPELSEDDSKEALNASKLPSTQARRVAMRDRLKRRRRLFKAIHLNTKELGNLLRFVYDHENRKEIEWTSDILYTHVPRAFESAAVSESLAAWVLENAMLRSLYDHFPSVQSDVQCFEGKHRIFELQWSGAEPVIPAALRDLPNLRLVKRERDVSRLGS